MFFCAPNVPKACNSHVTETDFLKKFVVCKLTMYFHSNNYFIVMPVIQISFSLTEKNDWVKVSYLLLYFIVQCCSIENLSFHSDNMVLLINERYIMESVSYLISESLFPTTGERIERFKFNNSRKRNRLSIYPTSVLLSTF